jgi:hypothetical protein
MKSSSGINAWQEGVEKEHRYDWCEACQECEYSKGSIALVCIKKLLLPIK